MTVSFFVPVLVRASTPHEHGPASGGSSGTVGVLLVIAVVLVTGVALSMLLLRRGMRVPHAVTGILAVGLVAVGVAALLASSDSSAPQAAEEPVKPDLPVLRSLSLPGQHLSVLVVPNRPGYNLVGVGGAEQASAGTDRARLTPGSSRPGSAQIWIGVNLPAGTSRLWVSTAKGAGSLTVDTGSGPATSVATLRGDDGPECAAMAVGAALAGAPRTLTDCPADALAPRDADALRSIVQFVASQGLRTLMLADDDSPRGRAAADTVRAAAREAAVTITKPARTGHPLVVVAGWKGAQAVVDDVARSRFRTQGTYLAPWLMTRPLLSPNANQLVPLRFAPRTAAPMAYVAELNRRIPGEYPSSAGYSAWQAVRGQDGSGQVRLYATALTYIPGQNFGPPETSGSGAHQHPADTVDWLPGGMIAEATRPLTAG